jgi:hypothetical protein
VSTFEKFHTEPMCQFLYLPESVPTNRFINRQYSVTHEEFRVCEAQLNRKGAELGFNCFSR